MLLKGKFFCRIIIKAICGLLLFIVIHLASCGMPDNAGYNTIPFAEIVGIYSGQILICNQNLQTQDTSCLSPLLTSISISVYNSSSIQIVDSSNHIEKEQLELTFQELGPHPIFEFTSFRSKLVYNQNEQEINLVTKSENTVTDFIVFNGSK